MKKLLALAVAGAFVAPVYADISLSGSHEFSYMDDNGSSVYLTDSTLTVVASTETATGISVSAKVGFNATASTAEGGQALTLKGPFGAVVLGKVDGGSDKFDGRGDFDLVTGGPAQTSTDASVGWTLPTFVEGLTVYLANQANTGDTGSGNGESTGIGLQYASGPVSVAFGQDDASSGTKTTYAGGTLTFGGIAFSLESNEVDTGVASALVDERVMAVRYTMGDIKLGLATAENKVGGSVNEELTFYQLQYTMGGGVTAFVESLSDSRDTTASETAVGIVYKF